MSEHFKKMALVPESMLNLMQQYQQQQITPQTRNLVRLDNRMGNILQDSALTEDEKARSYSQTLQRYLTMYDKDKTPTLSTPTEAILEGTTQQAPTTSEVGNEATANIEEELLHSVPQSFKGRAQSLLRKLKSHPNDLSWNNRGELISEGKVVSGTNVIDLINDVLRSRKNFSPRGYQA